MKIFIQWKDLDFIWSDIKRGSEFMTWSDIALIQEVEKEFRRRGTPFYDKDAYQKWIENNPWKQISKKLGEEKTEKFIKIFCSVNGIDYERMRRKRNEIKVNVDQFDRVFDDPKINIKVNI